MLTLSILSAGLAGSIIGMFFMTDAALASVGGVLGWAVLHAVDGGSLIVDWHVAESPFVLGNMVGFTP
jgi:hypothetical protein